MSPESLYINSNSHENIDIALVHNYTVVSECSDIRGVHKTEKYLNVFLLNVTVSEFHLPYFCAIYWKSRFRDVLPLGPDMVITKLRKASPLWPCVQMHPGPIGEL